MRAGILILSGFNIRAVVALCRWSARARIPAHLAARDSGDPIYLTDYAAQVFEQRTSTLLDLSLLTAWIQRLRAGHGYDRVLLAPSTEFLNRFLVKNREPIEAAGGLVPLVGADLYEQLSDKHAFEKLCASRGISVPATFGKIPGHLPFVAKPKTYGASKSGQIKPYLICTADDLKSFTEREDVANYTLQEFVGGQSLYLLAHISKNGTVTATAQENLIQQARGGSIVLARPHDFHRHPEARRYFQMLRDLGFHGLIMIEVRRCSRTGRHCMIEANPRLWGPIQFTLDQQVDLFGALLADHGLTVPPPKPTAAAHPYYFWSGGLAPSQAPCAFHQYSPDRFLLDFQAIAASDLFCRSDTHRLYEHELAQPAHHEHTHPAGPLPIGQQTQPIPSPAGRAGAIAA
jgi:predicted ATP-grasp superfamily ATP-dependent carboligase